MTTPNYSMLIQYSAIDNIYLVSILEFASRVPMPCTHGDTYEDAIAMGKEVIETFMEIWTEEGKAIPEAYTDRQHDSVRYKVADLSAQVWFHDEASSGAG